MVTFPSRRAVNLEREMTMLAGRRPRPFSPTCAERSGISPNHFTDYKYYVPSSHGDVRGHVAMWPRRER